MTRNNQNNSNKLTSDISRNRTETRGYQLREQVLETVSQPEQVAADTQVPGELPASYGDNRVYLVAKDPNWLFCYWDIDWAAFASLVKDSQVYLRLLTDDGIEASRTVINPYAQNWYLPVPEPGSLYIAELGYLDDADGWQLICRSESAAVPVMQVAEEADGGFARLPQEVSFEDLLAAIKSSMAEGETLVQALSRLQSNGLLQGGEQPSEWSPQRRRILEALLGKHLVERMESGSGLMNQALQQDISERLSSMPSSEVSVQLARAEALPTSLSSGFGAVASGGLGASWSAQPFSEQQERSFFMHVNAEVIFYGGTDPDARVWIDGNEVELQPDGSFHYHFKYPDGKYQIPIVARSPDGVEERGALLIFQRETSRQGEVGNTAQPSGLSQPLGQQK